MSITVIITRDDNGAPNTSEVYEEGAKFTVENGELNIISARPQLVALYGSGNWLSVHVDDHVSVVTAKPVEEESDDMDFGGFGDSDSSDSDDDSDTSADDSDTESPEASADESTESDTESTESDDTLSTE